MSCLVNSSSSSSSGSSSLCSFLVHSCTSCECVNQSHLLIKNHWLLLRHMSFDSLSVCNPGCILQEARIKYQAKHAAGCLFHLSAESCSVKSNR